MASKVNTSGKQNHFRSTYILGETASKAEVYAALLDINLQDFIHMVLEYYFKEHPLTITKR